MKTRDLHARLTGASPFDRLLSSEVGRTYYLAADRKEAELDRKTAEARQGNTPYTAAVQRRALQELTEEILSDESPVASKYSCARMAYIASKEMPSDFGIRRAYLMLKKAWEADTEGSYTVSELADLRGRVLAEFPKSAVRELFDDALPELTLDTGKLSYLASQIDTQEDYDYIIEANGLSGADHRSQLARKFILAQVNRREAVKPPDVSEETMHKLKEQEEKGEIDNAYAVAWSMSEEGDKDAGVGCPKKSIGPQEEPPVVAVGPQEEPPVTAVGPQEELPPVMAIGPQEEPPVASRKASRQQIRWALSKRAGDAADAGEMMFHPDVNEQTEDALDADKIREAQAEDTDTFRDLYSLYQQWCQSEGITPVRTEDDLEDEFFARGYTNVAYSGRKFLNEIFDSGWALGARKAQADPMMPEFDDELRRMMQEARDTGDMEVAELCRSALEGDVSALRKCFQLQEQEQDWESGGPGMTQPWDQFMEASRKAQEKPSEPEFKPKVLQQQPDQRDLSDEDVSLQVARKKAQPVLRVSDLQVGDSVVMGRHNPMEGTVTDVQSDRVTVQFTSGQSAVIYQDQLGILRKGSRKAQVESDEDPDAPEDVELAEQVEELVEQHEESEEPAEEAEEKMASVSRRKVEDLLLDGKTINAVGYSIRIGSKNGQDQVEMVGTDIPPMAWPLRKLMAAIDFFATVVEAQSLEAPEMEEAPEGIPIEADWWEDLSQSQKQKYIKEHPRSKRGPGDKPPAPPGSENAPRPTKVDVEEEFDPGSLPERTTKEDFSKEYHSLSPAGRVRIQSTTEYLDSLDEAELSKEVSGVVSSLSPRETSALLKYYQHQEMRRDLPEDATFRAGDIAELIGIAKAKQRRSRKAQPMEPKVNEQQDDAVSADPALDEDPSDEDVESLEPSSIEGDGSGYDQSGTSESDFEGLSTDMADDDEGFEDPAVIDQGWDQSGTSLADTEIPPDTSFDSSEFDVKVEPPSKLGSRRPTRMDIRAALRGFAQVEEEEAAEGEEEGFDQDGIIIY